MGRPSTVDVQEVAHCLVFEELSAVKLAQRFDKTLRWAQSIRAGLRNKEVQAAVAAMRNGQLEAIRRAGLSAGQKILDKHIAMGLDPKVGKTEVGRKCREYILSQIYGQPATGAGGGALGDVPFSQLPKEKQAEILANKDPTEAAKEVIALRYRPAEAGEQPKEIDLPKLPAKPPQERVG